jgi:hypothetical protein
MLVDKIVPKLIAIFRNIFTPCTLAELMVICFIHANQKGGIVDEKRVDLSDSRNFNYEFRFERLCRSR